MRYDNFFGINYTVDVQQTFRNPNSIAEIVLLFEVLIINEIETIMHAHNEQNQETNRLFEEFLFYFKLSVKLA